MQSLLGVRPGVGSTANLFDHAGVGQGRGVTQIPALGDVSQESAHDLAGAGLGKVVGEDDGAGPSDRADLGGHVAPEHLPVLLGSLTSTLKGHEGNDGLAGRGVRGSDYGRLGDRLVVDQGALHFRG